MVDVTGSFDALDSVRFVSTRSDSNVTMYAYDADGDGDLVVNDIGAFRGEYLMPSGTVRLRINSDGDWTMKKV